MDKSALHKLSYGIYILTTKNDGVPFGCVINTAFQITSSPARIAVSCNRENFTHDKIAAAGNFAISALAEDSDADLIKIFGYNSGRDIDKFAQFSPTEGPALGLPVFPIDSVATFECKVVNTVEVGTHTIFIGEIVDCNSSRPDAREMTYRYYHEIRKGRAPKNAPTFIEEAEDATTNVPVEETREKWKCSICGYVYNKAVPAFNDLDENWVCPVCGAAKSAFSKIG